MSEIPKPRDPREASTTPAQLDADVAAVLGETPGTLKEEADQLRRAHDIVHAALQ